MVLVGFHHKNEEQMLWNLEFNAFTTKKQRKNWDLTNKIGGIGHQLPRNTELLFMGIDLMGSVAPLSNGGFMG